MIGNAGPSERTRGLFFQSLIVMHVFRVPRFVFTLFLVLAIGPLGLAEDTPSPAPADWKPRLLKTWGKEGSADTEFNFPIGIAITPRDQIYVTDHYNNRVIQFDTEGAVVRVIPVLPNPGGIAVDAAPGGEARTIYVGHFPASRLSKEKTPDRVTAYTSEGKFVREWGKSGAGEGELSWIGGLAIGPKGEVYVCDQTNRRMQVFTTEGVLVRGWGKYGLKPGEFGGNSNPISRVGGPNFAAFDSTGHLYTTEASVGRVQKFTAEGEPVLAWGDLEDKAGHFGGVFSGFKTTMQGPIGVTVDAKDRVWVSAVSGRVQQFSSDGKFLRGFGAQGVEPGEFYAPHGIALDSKGFLYAVDAYNHRVQKFDVGE
jgi:DNA-binding beta-propeller fold protein YncE